MVNGQQVELVYKEDDWDLEQDASNGLYFCHEGRRYCAITGRFVTDFRKMYGTRHGSRGVCKEGSILGCKAMT